MGIADFLTAYCNCTVPDQITDQEEGIMKSPKALLTITVLLLGLYGVAYPRGWRGIVPLHSTRKDVERRLGTPKSACKCIYDLENATVQVTYSEGSCESGSSGGWNIPPGTVIRFNIHPNDRQPLSKFALDSGLDLRRFTKREDPELPGIFDYKDDQKGLIISVDRATVIDYGFEPTVQDKKLVCPSKYH